MIYGNTMNRRINNEPMRILLSRDRKIGTEKNGRVEEWNVKDGMKIKRIKSEQNQVEKQVPNGTGSWTSSCRRRMVGHERETFGTGETASGN